MWTRTLQAQVVFLALGLMLVGETPSFGQAARASSEQTRSVSAEEIWVAFDYSNSITAYSALSATGTMRQSRTIAGDRTGLERPAAVAVDERGTLYVTNHGNNSVTIYAPDAAGNVPPLRTLRGPSTGLASPRGITVDRRGAVYVTNGSRHRLTVYAPDADGNALPIRSIWGSRTRLRSPQAIAVDRRGALYVTSHSMGYILVFAPGANGNVRPVRDFRSTAYGPVGMKSLLWQGIAFPHALTFDRSGLLYVADWGTRRGPSIEVYPPDSRGITASLRTISGDQTGLDYPIGVSIDASGFVYVLNQSTAHSITVYAPRAVGDAAPIVKLRGDASGRPRPSPWDRVNQEPGDSAPELPSAVAIYQAGGTGDIAPEREITGARTGLHLPITLALADHGELYVLNCRGRVVVYRSDPEAGAIPVRDFGRASPLVRSSPTGLALDRGDSAFISFVRHEDVFWPGWIEVYAPGAAGHAAPHRRIDFFGAAANGLALDSHDRLYAGMGEGGFTVMHKSRLLRGIPVGEKPEGPDADPSTPAYEPFLVLGGTDNELFWPGAFALDSYQRLYVPNRDDAVRVYQTASGRRVRPMRTLVGPKTELDDPVAVAVGLADTLFVANVGSARGSSITVYPPNAAGDVAPIRTLRGARTRLGRTGALAVDERGRLYVLRKSPPGERCLKGAP
jgi:DNA-binding beta-propeller fold protein YncE